jgi:hypothetical protein
MVVGQLFNNMKLTIAFDGWTAGSIHLSPLSKELKNNNINLMLIHFGSYGHDNSRPKEEYINGMLTRDISYYNDKSILEILKLEKPNAVLFLSTRAFLHQACIRYCRHLNIPTFHRFHGLITVQPVDNVSSTFKPNLINRFNQILRILPKNLFKIYPIYFKSVFITNGGIKQIKSFFIELWSKFLYLNIPAPLDSQTDYAFIYNKSDLNYAIKTYHLKEKNICCIGNPDLTNFNIDENQFYQNKNSFNLKSKKVFYINTGLLEEGVVFNNEKDLINHFLLVNKRCETLGLKLYVKLHPSTEKHSIISQLNKSGINVVVKENFVEELKNSLFSIVEPSSASIIPAFFGIPIFMAKFSKLRSQKYGNVLSSYPYSYNLYDLEDLNVDSFFKNISHDIKSFNEWLDINLGPLPSSNYNERTSDYINNILTNESRTNIR